MNSYIIYSSIISLFSEALALHTFIDLKIFYLIIFINFSLILSFKQFCLHKWHFWGMFFVFSASGTIAIVSSVSITTNYLMQVVGISIVSIYYYVFFRRMGMSSLEMFQKYCGVAYIVAIIGLVIFLYNLLILGEFIRIESIMDEPAHLSALILPAWYYSMTMGPLKSKKFVVFSLVLILSGSSVGFLGVMLGVVLASNFNLIRVVLLGFLGSILLFLAYNFDDNFKLRVDDSISVVSTLSMSGANLSTYALFSNAYVAYYSFIDNPFFGGGLGSHKASRDKYLDNIDGIETFEQYFSLNEKDANSLFLRIVSELGVMGLIIVFGFIIRFGSSLKGEDRVVSRGILLYFFTKLLREGHYFTPEMYFFIMCYYFVNKQSNRNKLKKMNI